MSSTLLPRAPCDAQRECGGFDRRRFVKSACSLLTLLGTTRLVSAGGEPDRTKRSEILLATVKMLETVGGWAITEVDGLDILLARVDADTVRAFAAVCPHRRTNLRYSARAQMVFCPKHKSRFDLNGQVKKGPAKKNIRTYVAELDLKRGLVTVATPDDKNNSSQKER